MTRQQRLVLIVSILASFVAFLDGSIVNVALPAITRELGGGLAAQQWVVDAYLISLGSLILVAGSLSDLFGRKTILRLGLIGFLATSVLCAVAPSAPFLIVARGLQGIAGALLVPSSLALIIATFSHTGEGKAIGVWTSWTSIAAIIGPLCGGLLVDTISWRWVFGVNVLPIVVTLFLVQRIKIVQRRNTAAHIDIWGATLCAFGLGGSVFALIEQGSLGWSSPYVYLTLLGGAIALFLFLWHEQRVAQPMLPMGLFAVRNFGVGNVATLFIYAGLSLSIFTVIVFIQQVGHFSATQAGLTILPVTILMFTLSPRFGALSTKHGPRLFMGIGPIVAAAGFFFVAYAHTPLDYWRQFLPGLILFGVGLAMTVAPLTAAILGAIGREQAGIASAVNNAVARIAGLIAIASVGMITGSSIGVEGFHRTMIAGALLLVGGGLVSAWGIQNAKQARDSK